MSGTKCPYASLAMFGVASPHHDPKKMTSSSSTTTTTGETTSTTAEVPTTTTTIVSNDIDVDTSSNSSTSMLLVYEKCPAFQNGSCPFKDKKDATAVRETLLQIPSSHLQKDQHEFYKVLQQLHINTETTNANTTNTVVDGQDSNNNNNNKFQLPGGCPIANSTVGPKLLSKFKITFNTNTDTTTTTTNKEKEDGVSSKSLLQTKLSFTEAMENYSLASIMARMASIHDDDNNEYNDIEDTTHNEVDDNALIAGTNLITNKKEIISTVVVDDDIPKDTIDTAITSIDVTNAGTTTLVPDVVVPDTTADDDEGDNKNRSSSSPSSTTTNMRLSECFKTGTVQSHQAAEDVHFVKNFIRGEIDRELYKDLIVQLYYVYNALEEHILLNIIESTTTTTTITITDENTTVENSTKLMNDVQCLRTFVPFHERLQRKQTLIDDLDFWFGPTNTESIVNNGSNNTTIPTDDNVPHQSPACKDYVDRLQYIAMTEPLLLLAHSYTRYLGDLSGGKILARVAKRALNLGTNDTTSSLLSTGEKKKNNKGPIDGLAFYDFTTTISSAKKFKDEFKNALDSLPLTRQQISRLVQEANVAFVLNIRLFEELDVKAGVPNSTIRTLQDALDYGTKEYISIIEEEDDDEQEQDDKVKNDNGGAKCPFAFTTPTTNTTSHYSKTTFAKTHGKIDEQQPEQQQQKCPFANPSTATTISTSIDDDQKSSSSKQNDHIVTTTSSSRCPWPFIIFHDPIQGLRDWQTWAAIGLFASYWWFQLTTSLSSSAAAATTTTT